jgi:cytochrome c-type biogenesis protein CcmH/NrfF
VRQAGGVLPRPARRTALAPAVCAIALAACTAVLAPASLAAPASPAATGARPHVSLALIERQAMCVTCKVALNESQSPQADLERTYIKELIAKGDGEGQIKSSLVAQFGPTVLGMPSTHGFDLAVYLVPAAVVAALAALVVLLLPRWRRRERSRGLPGAPTLSPADAARLDSDLARFD